MGIRRRIRAYKAPNLANKLKRRSKKSRKLNLMKNPENTDLWDKFQTLKRNYKSIDIGLNLNSQNEILDTATPFKDNDDTVGYTDIRYLKEKALTETPREGTNELQGAIISQAYIEANKKTKRKAVINRDEAMCVKNLYKRYKKDFTKWRRDIKLNMFQWTEKQCSFKLKEYLKRFPDEKIDWKKVN
jgi:hypothetical protein